VPKLPLVLSVLVCLASPALAQSAGAPTTQLTVDAAGAQLIGIAPGSSAVLVGYGREHVGGIATHRYYVHERLTDGDADGRIVFEASERPIPELSVWVAYVVATGELLTATPSGEAPPLLDAPPGPPIQSAAFETPSSQNLLLVFRRDAGGWIWNGAVEALAAPDAAIPHSRFRLHPDSFLPIAGPESEAPLDRFDEGDLVLGIHQLDLTLTRYSRP
jgi:hypothetical protein